MIRQYDNPCCTSADKAKAIANDDYPKGGYIDGKCSYIVGENPCTTVRLKDGMRYTPIADNEDIEQEEDNHYGELAINLILIALIIAGLVLSYNIGFYK